MCRELSRCLCSLSSAGDLCWAKPNHAFSDCQHLRSFFFQAGRHGVIALAVRSGIANDDDDGRELAAPPTRFSQTAFFKWFSKTLRGFGVFDGAIASMRRGRDRPPSRALKAPKKNLRRRPRFASHHPDLRESARTRTTTRRCSDDCRRHSHASHRTPRRRVRGALDRRVDRPSSHRTGPADGDRSRRSNVSDIA